jgi:thiamine-phosphate pyrophosphorylase
MRAEEKGQMYLGGVCLVTDRNCCTLTCLEMARIALGAGIGWIQYREKEKSRLALYRTALALRKLTREHGAFLIINDHADIAASVGADGVHLGQEDLPVREARRILGEGKIVGVSTHALAEALGAEAEGADYIGFGPVFPTKTKEAGPPKGTARLKTVRDRVRIPVVAIGGICAGNLDDVFSSGAAAVAVASALLEGDVHLNAARFLERIGGYRDGKSA